MKIEMLMPQMGESITEATILKWLKNVGDKVEKDQTILEISTDKVDSEIPAPASGVLAEIIAKQGEVVAVKAVIARIETEAGASVEVREVKKDVKKEESQKVLKSEPKKEEVIEKDDRYYSPLVKNIASQHGLSTNELSTIEGSGNQGRVTKSDVISYLDNKGGSAKTVSSNTPAVEATKPVARPQFNQDGIVIEPFDNMRRLIAEHMVRSKATSPHVYSMAEVDVTNIAKYREKVQSQFSAREGFKLSFTPFFLEAVIKGLIQFPKINASVDGTNLIIKKYINLGCAVALGKDGTEGLIVPVIKSADQLNIVGIASALNDLAQKARNKKLAPDDIQGGTFTVTNPGVFGNIMGCPIISQPQLAILGIGAIKKRVMVVNDAIAIRDMVYLTLSYDHRVIDGSMAGQFLSFVTKYLENWDMNRQI